MLRSESGTKQKSVYINCVEHTNLKDDFYWIFWFVFSWFGFAAFSDLFNTLLSNLIFSIDEPSNEFRNL